MQRQARHGGAGQGTPGAPGGGTGRRRPALAALLLVAVVTAACGRVPQEALPVPSTVTVLPAPDAPPEPAAARPVPTTTTVATTTTSLPDSVTYEVKSGDTFSGIADRFGISFEALLKLNPLKDPGRLAVGQLLIVPGPTSPTSTTAGPSTASATGGSGTAGPDVTGSTLPAATKNG